MKYSAANNLKNLRCFVCVALAAMRSGWAFAPVSVPMNRNYKAMFFRHPIASVMTPPPNSIARSSSSALALSNNYIQDDIKKVKVLIAVISSALLLFNSIQVVDTGEIGIVNTLGSLSQLDPGLHLMTPLISRVDRLSTKTTLLEQSNFVPTKEGLTVELDTAILFRLDSKNILSLYGSVGKGYLDKLISPEASSAVRGLTSESEAKALYTSGRSEIQNSLKKELSDNLSPRGIIIEDVLLKAVILPKDLSASIEEKARAEQESARMEFVLKKETQEAQRKAIEAEGIAEFQRIVSKGITPSLLQWKGIEATEKLAKSPNSKVVIMGNSKDSLPVILGNDK